tara:strand:- start:1057 stop:2964 length:1908 start_codon:yes stop_codon:yes gene_type:complete
MLQAIRGKTASIVVKLLAGLLIVSFAAWGVEDFISARATDTVVASVGDRDIDPLDLEYELSRETARLRQMFGGQLNEAQLAQLGIGQAVLQRMINDAALAQEAADLGLRVSDAKVTQAIHADPSFNGFDGAFSRQRFNEVMRAAGLTEFGYIQQVRKDIANTQILQVVSGTAVTPSRFSKLLHRYRFEARSADTVLVSAAAQADPGTPTDADLQAIHDAQKERFTAPEYRKLTFVHLDPANLTSEVTASDEELQQAFEANAARFQKAEQRTVQQIVVNDEATAEKVQQKLAEGVDFLTVATEVGEMEAAAVDLGTVTRNGLLPDLADAVFAIDEGAVTETVATPLGFHVMRAIKVLTGVSKTLDDVRDEVTDIVKREKAVTALYDLSVRFEDAIGGGATLEEAGKSVGFDAVTLEAVDRQSMAPSGARAAGLPDLASLLPVAFASERGIESPLTEVGEKGFFMVRVDEIIPPALRPLADVKAEVAAVWAEVQRTEMAQKQAEALAEKVQTGTSMVDAAKTLGVDVVKIGPATRGDQNVAAQAVLARMFEINEGAAGIARVTGGYQVVHVLSVTAPTAGGDVPSVADYEKQLDEAVGNDLAAQAVEAIRNDYGVTVNQRILDAVMRPGTFDPRQPI